MQETTKRAAELARRREANARWRQKNKDYFRKWRLALSPEQIEDQRIKKAAGHARRRTQALLADREGQLQQERDAASSWRRANKDAVNDRQRARYAADPIPRRTSSRNWARANPESTRNRWLRLHYGISLEDYRALLEAQNGKCAICGEPETIMLNGKVKALHVDHDHSTGRVRGLLCFHCNAGLGHYRDDPALIDEASAYLRR